MNMSLVTVDTLREWRRTLEGAFYIDDEAGRTRIRHDRVELVLRAIASAEEDAYREEARVACRLTGPVPVEPELGWVGSGPPR